MCVIKDLVMALASIFDVYRMPRSSFFDNVRLHLFNQAPDVGKLKYLLCYYELLLSQLLITALPVDIAYDYVIVLRVANEKKDSDNYIIRIRCIVLNKATLRHIGVFSVYAFKYKPINGSLFDGALNAIADDT
jgi:hypothetical protein